MTRRIEMNPGEWFMIADRTILVTERESVLGLTERIGAPAEDSQVSYFFTFTGRVNHTDDIETVTVAMSPLDAHGLMSDILHGLELLVKKGRD